MGDQLHPGYCFPSLGETCGGNNCHRCAPEPTAPDDLAEQLAAAKAILARVRRYAHWLRQHQGVTGLTEGAALLRVLDEGWSPDDLPEPF